MASDSKAMQIKPTTITRYTHHSRLLVDSVASFSQSSMKEPSGQISSPTSSPSSRTSTRHEVVWPCMGKQVLEYTTVRASESYSWNSMINSLPLEDEVYKEVLYNSSSPPPQNSCTGMHPGTLGVDPSIMQLTTFSTIKSAAGSGEIWTFCRTRDTLPSKSKATESGLSSMLVSISIKVLHFVSLLSLLLLMLFMKSEPTLTNSLLH
mmetsp:Transcript_8940/g.32925  ORF Transcript_8940/g.32925 Transcript_8940/m.32925 type:complete len:207 (+) Transcript_8940:1473-2093(+)